MDSIVLIETIRRAAKVHFANGNTSSSLYAFATEQDRTGFGISADYTRLLAQAVAALEKTDGG